MFVPFQTDSSRTKCKGQTHSKIVIWLHQFHYNNVPIIAVTDVSQTSIIHEVCYWIYADHSYQWLSHAMWFKGGKLFHH